MAVNDNMERDPQLVRWYQAAGGEEPPAALDDAIRAAARREVNARPQSTAGGGTEPAVRQKRSWYVPMSIAAVLVLSVSLVTLIKEEKGIELQEAPRTAAVPAAPAPRAETPAAPTAAQSDDVLKDMARSETRPPEMAKADAQPKAAKPQAAEPLLQKQRAPAQTEKKTEAVPAERDQRAVAEPFPMSREREVSAAGRAELETAQARRETTRGVPPESPEAAAPPGTSIGALMAAKPRAKSVPAPVPTPEPAAPTESQRDAGGRFAQGRPSSTIGIRGLDSGSAPAESRVENRPSAAADAAAGYAPPAKVPPPAPAAVAPPPPPAAKPAPRLAEQARPPLLWRDLENQPPEKWLERIAELRRQNREPDVDELLAEFRRRFPDHPASQR